MGMGKNDVRHRTGRRLLQQALVLGRLRGEAGVEQQIPLRGPHQIGVGDAGGPQDVALEPIHFDFNEAEAGHGPHRPRSSSSVCAAT